MSRMKSETDTSEWQFLVDAAKRGLEGEGYSLTRVPGRGLSNIWTIERDGKTQSASIRTTRNRWIAFPPLSGGTRWKTLDDVDLVVVASVDSQDKPGNVEIYIFPAAEVRARFNAAYSARKRAGQTVRDDFGMWIGLDVDDRGVPSSVGSGLAATFRPVATYSFEILKGDKVVAAANSARAQPSSAASQPPGLKSIADVLAWTRQRIADIAGVRADAVKLDLKIEY